MRVYNNLFLNNHLMKENCYLKLMNKKLLNDISIILTNGMFILVCCLIGCESSSSSNTSHRSKDAVYVKSNIDYKGKFHKGYVRFPVSTSKNTMVKNSKSKYYYETKGKYMKSKK